MGGGGSYLSRSSRHPASEVGLNMALQLAPQCTRPPQGSGGRFLRCHRPAQFGP